MPNHYTVGILIVLACAALYTLAWREARQQAFRTALAYLLIGGLALRLFAAWDGYLHKWDERYHAVVAKNMMEEPLKPMLYKEPVLAYDYRDWSSNHVWLHKQPLALWAISVSLKLFGVNELAIRLPAVLLSTLGIWLMFGVGRHFFGNRVGFLSAFFFSIHGMIIELASGRRATDHVDAMFTCLILLAVYLAVQASRQKGLLINIACGFAIGLAVLTKWLPALIVLPVWLLLVLDSRKYSYQAIIGYGSLVFGVALLVFVPWQVFVHHAYPQEAYWEQHYNYLHLFEGLEGHDQSFYFHFDRLRMIYGELVYLPILWFVVKTFKRPSDFKRLAIFAWFAFPFAFFSFAATKLPAYTLISAPAIFLMTALFFEYVRRHLNRFRYRWLAVLVLIGLIALPVRYSLERVKPFSSKDRNPEWVEEIKALRQHEQADGKLAIFNAPNPIETMFYVDCSAYPFVPADSTLQQVAEQGYKVIVLEGAVPRPD